jgi:hypothetical protein
VIEMLNKLIEKIKNVITKSWMKRAIRTFVQSAVGYILVAVPAIDWTANGSALKTSFIGIGMSAVSAGIAAIMNYTDEG